MVQGGVVTGESTSEFAILDRERIEPMAARRRVGFDVAAPQATGDEA
jgi:hypothetical protein